jgi:hypothetical protein
MNCIHITNPNEKLVNLNNVSTISLDCERNKIIYNFTNSINILGRETPDYSYQTFETFEEAENVFFALKELKFVQDNFLISSNINNSYEIVNKNFVTSINLDEKHKRIIFNLNYSVTIIDHKTNKPIKISKFVYYNYNSRQEMKKELGSFVKKLYTQDF